MGDGLAALRARDVSSVGGTMGCSSSAGIRDFSSVTRTRDRLSVEGTGGFAYSMAAKYVMPSMGESSGVVSTGYFASVVSSMTERSL